MRLYCSVKKTALKIDRSDHIVCSNYKNVWSDQMSLERLNKMPTLGRLIWLLDEDDFLNEWKHKRF